MFTVPATDPSAPVDIHTLLDPLTEAGVLSPETCDAACREVEALLEVIRGPLTGEDFWKAFQREFGFGAKPESTRYTPMNAANLCPEPTRLLRAANILREAYNEDVAQQGRMYRTRDEEPGPRLRQMEAARAALARGLGLPASAVANLALVRNASEGNNAINRGFSDWHRDALVLPSVVLWDENHPTNLAAWRLRASYAAPEFDVRVVEKIPYGGTPQQIARAFLDKVDGSTRFLSFSETANGSGFRIPEETIAILWETVTRDYPDCHIHIDGTMTFGSRPINLGNPQCHSFVSSAHKWFLGPKETAILYMAPEKAPHFQPSIFAYDNAIRVPGWNDLPKTARRFELLGQRDDVNIIALAATQLMWTALQPRKPYERVALLARELKTALRTAGWTVITPPEDDRSWGIVRVKAPKEGRSKNLYNWMYDNYRIAGSGDDAEFRLCPHIYNLPEDLRRAVGGMHAWRRSG